MAKLGDWAWHDLTVSDAGAVKDFYQAVCGWTPRDHEMGDYTDFDMLGSDGETVAGICHARGENAKLPPVWMPYVFVADVDAAIAAAEARGGTLIERRPSGNDQAIAYVKDPAGAAIALWGRVT